MKQTSYLSVVAAACFLLSAHGSQGALIASESFDYAEDAVIDGLNGGTGWLGPWFNNGSSTGFKQIQSEAVLSFGELSTSGFGLEMAYPGPANGAVAKTFRALSANQNTGTVWISYLSHGINLDSTDTFKLTLYNATNGSSNEGISFGKLTNGPNLGVIASNAGATFQSTTVSPNGGTHLLVLEYNLTLGTANFYIDPALGGAAPTTPNASITGAANAFQSIRLENYAGNTGTAGATGNENVGRGYIDELRIGTTFADVAPVPEPSAGLLALLGGVTFLVRRKRR